MTIVSSEIIDTQVSGSGQIVCERHIDHLGEEHVRYHKCPLGSDLNAKLAEYAALLVNTLLKKRDRQNIERLIQEGADPATVPHPHLTNGEALTVVLKTAMLMPATDAIPVAEFVGTLTDNQIINVFNVAKKDKIRARAASILAMKDGLEADKLLEEEI